MSRSIFDDRTFAERVTDVLKLGSVLVGSVMFLATLVVVISLLGAWGQMLVVGILHGDYWHHIPTMSFATAFKLNLVLSIFIILTKAITELAVAWFKDVLK
jgi:hypothetical protein